MVRFRVRVSIRPRLCPNAATNQQQKHGDENENRNWVYHFSLKAASGGGLFISDAEIQNSQPIALNEKHL
jgi:hypothetical protein